MVPTPSMKLSLAIAIAVAMAFMACLPGSPRSEEPSSQSYLDKIVHEYFQKWEDSLEGGYANETITQMTHIDNTFNTIEKSVVKIQFQKEKKNKNYDYSMEIKSNDNQLKRRYLITDGNYYNIQNKSINAISLAGGFAPTLSPSTGFEGIFGLSFPDLLEKQFFFLFSPKKILASLEVTRFEDDGKFITFYLREKKKQFFWDEYFTIIIIFHNSRSYPVRLQSGDKYQIIYDIKTMNARPVFNPDTFNPPKMDGLVYTNLVDTTKYDRIHPCHPGPQPCK